MTIQELQNLKNKYDIIGNDPALNRALEVAVTVAPTDITVLVTGESGVGKENIPRIIHQNSARKRGKYFAINCGAIPEATVLSAPISALSIMAASTYTTALRTTTDIRGAILRCLSRVRVPRLPTL